jgi:hypothetical protein
MGHIPGNVSDDYLASEVEPYLTEDAERMGELLRGAGGRSVLRIVG